MHHLGANDCKPRTSTELEKGPESLGQMKAGTSLHSKFSEYCIFSIKRGGGGWGEGGVYLKLGFVDPTFI